MLHPSHTPIRAATGGGLAPNDENQTKHTMQPIPSSIRIIEPTELLGRVRRNPKNAETITKASPAKNVQ
jgi:hypothetical protein